MKTSALRSPRFGYKAVLAALCGAAFLFGVWHAVGALLQQEELDARLRHDGASVVERSSQKIRLVLVAQGFKEPTDIQFVPGAPRSAIILEKGGTARLLQLDAAGKTVQGGSELFRVAVKVESEMGLLGLAFHPDFASNRLFYVHYNPEPRGRHTRIAEWQVDSHTNPHSARELRVLLEVAQPYRNHKGGQLAFGPDRMLYVALGDGGYRGDPERNGQNPASLLGKILRLDPAQQSTIPVDNPFLKKPKFRPEIWAYGLRNPWRFSFTERGEVITGDVGQDLYEEINLIRAGDNLGWNVREAGHCFAPSEGCSSEGFVDPIFEYGRSLGISVTGGYVYRGIAVPGLAGKYVFGDFGSGRLWALPVPTERGGAFQIAEPLGQYDMQYSTFGQDADGELYVTDFYRGKIYKISAP